MNCVGAMLTACSNVQDLSFAYGYLLPSGTVHGVIVYFDGGDGMSPAGEAPEFDMLQYYVSQGYEVVQVAWSSAWEATYNPFPITTPPTFGNIQNAACRPATFLNYVATAPASWNLYQAALGSSSSAGMCAQGFSAGSTQILFSMAYYGAGSYLDTVELISGPVFSDVQQGCQEGPPGPLTVCPAGQWGCGSQASWALPPTYLKGANYNVGSWTNDNSCAMPGTVTSFPSESRWLAQSIVDKSTGGVGQGAIPTFSYPSTAMAAWLCRSVKNPLPDCSGLNYVYQYCPNESSSQGEIFYAQITSSNSPYNVYAVDTCNGPEGAPLGTVPALSLDGQTAIELNMKAHCAHPTH